MKKQTSKQRTIGLNPLEAYLLGPSAFRPELQEDIEQKTEQPIVQELQSVASPVEPACVLQESISQVNTSIEQEVTENVSDNVVSAEQNSYENTINNILTLEVIGQAKKQRVTIHVPEELIDRVKDAVYWEPGLTLAGFAQYALSKTLEELEKERGKVFPSRRTRQLRGGRPVK